LEDWENYDDILNLKLVKIITDNGDDYSASVFLGKFLSKEEHLFKNDEDKKSLIDKLFHEKRNRYFHYLSGLAKLNLSASDLNVYIESLKDEGIYSVILWLEYFRVGNKEEKQAAAKRY
jgi:hypothetical protein